jgi:hypothetical protein
MKQSYLGKSRAEQDEDFLMYFSAFADKDCKICYGTGKKSWLVDLQQYIPCECVMINIEKEKRLQESKIIKVKEVIN